MSNRFALLIRSGLLVILLLGMVLQPQSAVYAAANLTITPLTWNVVGLDSNNVNVGPNNFPVGARVCNTGDTTATNVSSTFNWETVDPTPAKNYINLRPGSNTSYSGYTLAPSACVDFYYEVQVTRNSNAYGDTRQYYITATADTLGTITTPRPREIFVEHLISQNRNAVTDVKLNGASITAGGTMNLMVGNTYTIQLVGSTATQGYEQLESFINFPNTIFQVNSVTSTYSATDPITPDPLATTRPYADGCNWVNDPGSPNYRSCTETGKYGGNITVTYNVTILAGAGTTQTLNTLIYDFSGSSYHYNADFSTGARFASIIGPSSIGITKTFSPKAISPGGTSVLTFKLTNPTTETITGANFTDSLLGGLKVASTPNVSYSGCGSGAFSPVPVANATSLSFSNGTIAPNSTCTITVTVTADTAADYPNTTSHLFINTSVDTGNSASDSLKVSSASACVPGQTLATWTFPSGSSATTPAPATQAGNVATATASTTVTAPTNETNIGNPAPSWSGRNFPATGAVTGDTSPYFQFVIDTSKYSGVQVSLSYSRDSNWGGGSATTPTIYAWSSTTGGAGSFGQIFSSTTFDTTFRSTGNLNAAATGSSLTYFRINAVGATNANSFMQIDTVTFTGCLVPAPAPTMTKSFSPDPIVKGATSTLTFTINNTAAGNVAQTGISFTDVLPNGLSVANGTTSACNGTNNLVTTATTRTIALTGSSLAAGGSCTFNVTVTGTVEGAYENITGFLSSNESGTSTSYATDTLTVIAPPNFEKSFSPSSILTGATSVLQFTITNPNQGIALTGIGFTDILPAGVTAVDGNFNYCNGTLAITGGNSLTFTGGSVNANSACTFTVTVTGTTIGTKNNSTTNITSTEGGNGNAASATLVVSNPQPLIGLLKQISTDNTNWVKYLGLIPPDDIFYRFTITNDGETTLDNINVTDPDLNMSACLPALPTSLAVGASASCVVGPISVTSAPTPNPFINTGTVTTTTYTPPTPVTSVAMYGTESLAIVKNVLESYFTAAGNLLHYSYTVTNDGGYPLIGPVTVTDDKVGAITCQDTSAVGDLDNYLDPGETVTCPATGTVTYTVLANPDVSPNRQVTNTAHATAGGVNSPDATKTVPLAADLTVTKTNNVSGTVALGSSFTWSLTVANSGNSPATFTSGQTILSDSLPAGPAYGAPTAGTFVNITNSANISCSITTGTLACTASGATVTIGIGGSFVVSFTVTPASGASLANTATVDPGTNIAETNEANNTGSDTVNVSAPDFSTAKTDNTTTYTPGTAITYIITVSNIGNDVANGTVTDNFPASLTNITWSCTPSVVGATCSALGVGNINDSISIPVGQFVTYTVNATVLSSATGNLVNTATAALSSGTDPTPGNNSSTDTDTPNPQSDLAITKTDGVVSVNAGGTTIYTIRITNNGPSDVTGATLSDPTATGLSKTGVSCSATPGQCLTPPSFVQLETGTFVLPALTSGQFYEITVTANVTATSGNVTNTATVTAPAGTTDPDTTNNTASDTDAIISIIDVSLDKQVSNAAPNVGSTVTFTLVIANAGPSTATNIGVTDVIPSGYTYVAASIAGGDASNDTNPATTGLTWTINSLASGASVNLSYQVTVLATGVYDNYAEITSHAQTDSDSTPGNNSTTEDDDDTQIVSPNAVIDVSLGKQVNNATPNVGSTVTFTLVVNNAGPSTATGMLVIDALPSGYSYVSASITGGDTRNDTNPSTTGLVWTINSLAAGASVNLTYQAVVLPTGVYDNYAQILDHDQTDIDSTPGDNSTTDDDDDLVAVTPIPIVDLSLDKQVSNTTPTVGSTVTFTLVIANAGPSSATNIVVTDAMPSGYTYVAASIAGGDARDDTSPAINGLAWTINNLASGASVNLTYQATVLGTGTYDNYAEITSHTQTDIDSTPNNGSTTEDDDDTETVTPVALVDLSLDKQVSNATPNVGSTITFTLVIANAGPSTATNINVTDVVPSGYSYVTSSIAGGDARNDAAPSTTGLTWMINSLASGVSVNLTYDVTVLATGPYDNYAEITSHTQTDADSTPGNSSATEDDDDTQAVTPVAVVDVSLDKQVSNATPIVGATVTFTLVVANAGPSTATNVNVADIVPNGYAYVASSIAGGDTRNDTNPSTTGLTWVINSLASGASVNLTYQTTVLATGAYDNYAEITSHTETDVDSIPGNNSTTEDDNDTQNVNPGAAVDLSLDKQVSNTTPNIGDMVTFTLTIANAGPSPATNINVTDVIPSGYTYVAVSITGGDTRNDANPSTTGLTWTINSLASGASANLTYQATVLASGAYDNYAEITSHTEPDVDSTPGNNSTTEDDDDTEIVTPGAALVADPALSKAGNPTQASVGATVTFSLTVTNAGNTPAPNVVVTDTLPAMFDVTAVTVSGTSLPLVNVTPPIGTGPAPYTVEVTLNSPLAVTDIVTVTITTTVNSLGTPPISNSARVSTSATSDIASNNSDTVTITLRDPNPRSAVANRPALLPATGFAPDVETMLPVQPHDLLYTATDVMLEIPSLGVKLPIVGVPKKSGTWDVSWLGRQAGWLEGSAFPSWSGNSVLTSHVYDSNGLPGPFVNLNKLKYGDQVIVHAYGQQYIFEVQSNQVVAPTDRSAFKHEEKSWLTLITCKEYDEKTNSYNKRVIVHAMLVKVVWDK